MEEKEGTSLNLCVVGFLSFIVIDSTSLLPRRKFRLDSSRSSSVVTNARIDTGKTPCFLSGSDTEHIHLTHMHLCTWAAAIVIQILISFTTLENIIYNSLLGRKN
jgi:hypothetical protein